MATLIPFEALEDGNTFQGYRYENAGASCIVNSASPGDGPALHTHPYAEVFVVLDGQARFTAGNETLEVTGGHILVVPANTPHKFLNTGPGTMRSVHIHCAGKMETTWLEQ
jgi:mannose-6-phosphate isomerase-like protein (cupin superfamily)